MEEGFVVCKVCNGIMRQASLCKGVTTCSFCGEAPDLLNSVNIVQETVSNFEIKCPLTRDCKWNGKLSEAERHLETCVYFLIKCRKCDQIFSRGETDYHNINLCPMREVDCEYSCGGSGTARDIGKHNKLCANCPIDCPNGCGMNLQRKEIAKHRSECQFEELKCPFTEYGCNANPMIRRDLLRHKKEFYIEHLDMSHNKIRTLENVNQRLIQGQTEMK